MSEVGGNSSSGMVGGSEVGGMSTPGGAEISGASASASAEVGSSKGGAETAPHGAENILSGHEIAIAPHETTTVRNQILKMPETTELERAQAQIEAVHETTIRHVLEKEGNFISAQDRARIEAGLTKIEAVEGNNNSKTTGGYHYDNNSSSIYVYSLNEAQRERTTIHETKHFTSHNREIIIPMPDKGGYKVCNTIGTRQASYFHSTETGENSDYTECGRGLNEGLTTMYTNRYLTELSPEKGKVAEQQQIYGHATDLAIELENIMGKDTLKEAYYGGDIQKLESMVNSLAGEKEFAHLRECFDRVISDNYTERVAAMREAQEILAKTAERKNEV
jgi:hypothetical protein